MKGVIPNLTEWEYADWYYGNRIVYGLTDKHEQKVYWLNSLIGDTIQKYGITRDEYPRWVEIAEEEITGGVDMEPPWEKWGYHGSI